MKVKYLATIILASLASFNALSVAAQSSQALPPPVQGALPHVPEPVPISTDQVAQPVQLSAPGSQPAAPKMTVVDDGGNLKMVPGSSTTVIVPKSTVTTVPNGPAARPNDSSTLGQGMRPGVVGPTNMPAQQMPGGAPTMNPSAPMTTVPIEVPPQAQTLPGAPASSPSQNVPAGAATAPPPAPAPGAMPEAQPGAQPMTTPQQSIQVETQSLPMPPQPIPSQPMPAPPVSVQAPTMATPAQTPAPAMSPTPSAPTANPSNPPKMVPQPPSSAITPTVQP